MLDCFDTISFSGFHRMDNLLKCHTYAFAGIRLIVVPADRWPIQAVLWLEWGTSTAVNIPLRFADQKMHTPGITTYP